MIETNKDGYIINIVSNGEGLKSLLCDRFGRYQYKLVDGKPVYSPHPYTPKQLEQLRKEWCQAEIRKLYSVDDEAKVLRRNMMSKEPTEEFLTYNTTVEKIIAESKEKDFQTGGIRADGC